jgi:parallel beta-helix repeat protein
MPKDSIAFMSYVHFDDEHENGRLTQFCKRISGEIQIQTGEKFLIFLDRKDITWGQQWKDRIEKSIDSITFLIPIITPGYFKSEHCRGEYERFLEREKGLGRNDLIFPVYYVDCPVLNDDDKREEDELAKDIAARQYLDWRELRFEPMTSQVVGKTIAAKARQIVEAMERMKLADSTIVSKKTAKRSSDKKSDNYPSVDRLSQKTSSEGGQSKTGPTAKTEIPTIVVDAFHRGDYSTLTEALNAAQPGDRILVRPGLYQEGIVIDKPVEIIGDGELSEIVIEAGDQDVILFKANIGRISNLTLRQMGGDNWYCVDISQGRLELEGCDITSNSLACIGIHGGADPRIRRNRIHDSEKSGVFVYDNGKGILEENDIFSNAFSCIEIKTGGNPTFRRNQIHDGKAGGVFVYENGQGILEENDIFANQNAGVNISEGGNPTFRRNQIHDGKSGGVYVYKEGLGTLEENDIFANQMVGVNIRKGGNPTLRRNRINRNAFEAIRIMDGGLGFFEDNDLTGNAKGAWDIAPECLDKVIRNGNKE